MQALMAGADLVVDVNQVLACECSLFWCGYPRPQQLNHTWPVTTTQVCTPAAAQPFIGAVITCEYTHLS